LSDIHSNLEAFQAVLEMARGKYDQAACLGDVVGYGPDPNAVIGLLRQISCAVIRGNHDKACSGITTIEDLNPIAKLAILWTRQQLTPENLAYLRQLQAGPLAMAGFEMVHGSAEDEDQYLFGPAEAIPALRKQAAPLVLFGHTHHQGGFALSHRGLFKSIAARSHRKERVMTVDLRDGARYLINPGSTGQPRDRDWRAAFAILDESKRQIEFYRAPYELALTQKKMAQAGLPQFLIDRLSVGR
ncbi:MAG: metallophosphoesterase family protein, partial [Terriglobia bacterium]